MYVKDDVAVRLACKYLRKREAKGKSIPKWAREWWFSHKKIDAERSRQ